METVEANLNPADLSKKIGLKELDKLGPQLRKESENVLKSCPEFTEELLRLTFAGELYKEQPPHPSGYQPFSPRPGNEGYTVQFKRGNLNCEYVLDRSKTDRQTYIGDRMHNVWYTFVTLSVYDANQGDIYVAPTHSFQLSWEESRDSKFKLSGESNYKISSSLTTNYMEEDPNFGGSGTYGALSGSREVLGMVKSTPQTPQAT